jgi:hypothetical protein
MKESVAIAKGVDTKKDVSPTKIDNRIRNKPERQLGSLRSVIDNIIRDGGTPLVDNIATELSSMHTAERASVLLALQRTHGNRYVQRVVKGIQAKLKVGQPGDVYEQEADRAAEQVMRMPEPTSKPFNLQRHEVEEDNWKKKNEEELIMTKGISEKAPEVCDGLYTILNLSRSSGQPLPIETRTSMEERFGVDFSAVRIHTDTEAAQMARQLNAEAFTYGRNIYFGVERYSLGAAEGKRLLAHELTHVVQQIGGIHSNVITGSGENVAFVDNVKIREHHNVPHIQRWALPTDWLDYIGLGIDAAERIYIELAYEEGEEKNFQRAVNTMFFIIDGVFAVLPAAGGGGLAFRATCSGAATVWGAIPASAQAEVIEQLARRMGWSVTRAAQFINRFLFGAQGREGGGGGERPAGRRRSEHSEQRRATGRRTGPAFNDAQRARQNDVFIQPNGRYVVRGPRGREHIFEPDGELVTSLDRARRRHLEIVRQGERQRVALEQFEAFQRIFQ